MRTDAGGKLAAREPLDARGELWLHEAAGAFGDECIEIDAIDDIERVDDVALRLRHLLTLLIEDEPGDVNVTKRHVLHELEPEHQHACHPEENDVEAGDEHVGGI